MKTYDDFDLDFKQMSEGDLEGEDNKSASKILSHISVHTVVSYISKTYLKCTDGKECATPTKDRPAASCHKKALAGTVQPRC